MVVISIPVKSYVKKYLVKRYGSTHQISKNSFIGLFLTGILSKKITYRNYEKKKLTDSIDFELSTDIFYTEGHTISSNDQVFFSRCIEKLFLEDFYLFVDNELQMGNRNAMKAVKTFLNLYSITESELKVESMYRNYQRHCNEKITLKKVKLSA